jgi:hypothetical protein
VTESYSYKSCMSIRSVKIVHDGAEARRVDTVMRIVEGESALARSRVVSPPICTGRAFRPPPALSAAGGENGTGQDRIAPGRQVRACEQHRLVGSRILLTRTPLRAVDS